MNSRVYYKFNKEIEVCKEKLELLENEINNLKSKSSKFSKNSPERLSYNKQIEDIRNSKEYIKLKERINAFEFAINILYLNN